MTKNFNELGLSEQALAAVDALGYTEPTPVQEQAIPAVLAGRDVIAAAKTGTGKTAAFSLPALATLGHARHGQGPLMLVVTSTRELAMQIEEVCRTIAKQTHHHITCVVGGVSYEPQTEALTRGTDVLIATPGRLIDLLDRGAAHLNQVEVLVLDEADRMLDMGFLPDMKRIVGKCPKERQTMLFSATIDEGIEKNMSHLLNDPVFVEIAHKGETADTVDQYIIQVDQRAKADLLIALLKEKGGTRIIVFTRTRHRADNCCRRLRRAGFSAEAIHSDRSQNQRKRALDAFADGKCDVLVATDVLARGIDVSNVNYVVNFDIPTQAEDYIHRIGRTGRAGEEGFAVSFVTPETKQELADIEKLIGRQIPQMEVTSFDAAASEAAIAAKATRKTGRKDPELAQAAREYANSQKKKKARESAKQEQPRKTRGTAQKEGKKSQKQASGKQVGAAPERTGTKSSRRTGSQTGNAQASVPAQANPTHRNTSKKSGADLRPGRAQRANRAAQHNRSQTKSGGNGGGPRRGGNRH